MTPAPRVSVILPTHKRAQVIGPSLSSVLTQTFRDLEVIVLDDEPGDGTEAIVRGFNDARVRYVSYPARRGVAAARNQGLQLARGELVAFQDSDDEWLPDKLEYQVRRLDDLGEGVALTQAAVLRIESGRIQHLFNPAGLHRDAGAFLECNMNTFLQGWLARRSALLACEGFDERLQLWEDWEYLIRIANRYAVDMDDRIVAVIYDTPGSLIKQSHRRRECMQIIVDKHQAQMQGDRTAMARNLYVIGRFQLLEGDASGGRASLLRSIRLAPGKLRAWVLLGIAAFGTAVVRATLTRLDRLRYG